MTEKPETFDRILLLADESADWKIAGLRQLDRLVLALNELEDSIEIVIFWRPEIAAAARWLPPAPPRTRVSENFAALPPGVRIITTRLLVDRHGLREYLASAPAVRLLEPQSSWRQLAEEFENSCTVGAGWKYLKSADDRRGGEKILLRRAGKSQDGMVSKFLNRPLSRPVTYLLLRFPITPTTWSLAIFVLPLAAFFFLLRGDYASIVFGCALYQLSSMLDGCDGEIARAKYLESERGGRIDSFCDLVGGFLFVLGLGFGLAHTALLYPLEGILTVIFLAAHEWLLRISKREAKAGSNELTGALYARHREVVEQSGVLFLGEKFVWWILQLTKRDVTILFFLLLAIAGEARWILHYSVVAAAIGLALSGITRLKARSGDATP